MRLYITEECASFCEIVIHFRSNRGTHSLRLCIIGIDQQNRSCLVETILCPPLFVRLPRQFGELGQVGPWRWTDVNIADGTWGLFRHRRHTPTLFEYPGRYGRHCPDV